MRVALLIAALALGAAGLTGCGGGGASATASSTTATAAAKAHHRARTAAITPATGSYRGRVPILMYHVVTAPPAGTTYPDLWVPWPVFVKTMLGLKRAGYQAVTLGAVWRAWHGGPGLPRHPMVVSFDDGYLSQSNHARPTLRALGWPGVLFLEGKNIDPKVGLSRHQIRKLIANGWEIDAHTLTHPDLTTVGDAQLQDEIAGSRRKIQQLFGVPADFFAYPSGRYNAHVEAAVKAAGFQAAVTTQPGVARRGQDPYALPRIRVQGSNSPQTVISRVRAGGTGGGTATGAGTGG